MSLKEVFKSDLDIFINMNELAELHNINGSAIQCIIDEDALVQRSISTDVGVSEADMTVYVRTEDLRSNGISEKSYGELLRIDYDTFTVTSWEDVEGMTQINLMKGVS